MNELATALQSPSIKNTHTHTFILARMKWGNNSPFRLDLKKSPRLLHQEGFHDPRLLTCHLIMIIYCIYKYIISWYHIVSLPFDWWCFITSGKGGELVLPNYAQLKTIASGARELPQGAPRFAHLKRRHCDCLAWKGCGWWKWFELIDWNWFELMIQFWS